MKDLIFISRRAGLLDRTQRAVARCLLEYRSASPSSKKKTASGTASLVLHRLQIPAQRVSSILISRLPLEDGVIV